MERVFTKPIKIEILAFLCFFQLSTSFLAQEYHHKNDVFVDQNGVMRWGDHEKEVYGFGVNYTVPFAHAHRQAKKMGIDPKKAIDQDVYHFSRLGFDLYRVHVWDTQISDEYGNLIDNRVGDSTCVLS